VVEKAMAYKVAVLLNHTMKPMDPFEPAPNTLRMTRELLDAFPDNTAKINGEFVRVELVGMIPEPDLRQHQFAEYDFAAMVHPEMELAENPVPVYAPVEDDR
jgi:hypothetical protein